MNAKLKNWFLVVVWVGIIFFLSHQPSLQSGFPHYYDFVLRKLAHITEYFILTFLLIRALAEYNLSKKKILIIALVLAFLYATSDEYHQTFIVGRQGAIMDVMIDSIGILLSTWLGKIKMIKLK
ncbi:MAG: VanZ family protein [bacterium]